MLKDMEDFIKSIPKPLLALIVLILGVGFFMLNSPPHTICDTQLEVFRESQKGKLFPLAVQVQRKQETLPAQITKAKEACQVGNSAGSCYEYFSALKDIAVDIGKASSQCTPEMFQVPEVQRALRDGVEVMARIAWGSQPPDPGFARLGWFQDAEIAIFCRIKNIYIRGAGNEAWDQLRRMIYTKLPGEAPKPKTEPDQIVADPRPAPQTMAEQAIWDRSLFSVRCESYL
jgi:hypothetical protein